MVLKRISLVLLIILIMSFMFNIYISSQAEFISEQMISDTYSKSGKDTTAKDRVSKILSVIITIVRIAGVCIAIVMLLAVAMKYMTAAAGEKAEIKKSAVQYVVGAVVLFGAVGILGLINNFSKNVSK